MFPKQIQHHTGQYINLKPNPSQRIKFTFTDIALRFYDTIVSYISHHTVFEVADSCAFIVITDITLIPNYYHCP